MSNENTILVHNGQVIKQKLSTDFENIGLTVTEEEIKIEVPANNVVRSPLMIIYTNDDVAKSEINVEIKAHAVLNISQMAIGDGDFELNCNIALVGQGAESEVKTVALASGDQQQKIAVKIENLAPHTTANIVNHGVVQDTAHLAFDGTGKIHKGMKASDAQQETRILNLSKTAKATANPFLLIDEGDITAGHPASIGPIDEEQIYYLMSRGMNRRDASKMIVSGFLTPFIDAIEDEKMRATLVGKIESKLG